jgi:hypothetical protein
MIILSSIAFLYAAGALILANGIRHAPEGYENESGFNLVWQNNDPNVPDVACVWDGSMLATA